MMELYTHTTVDANNETHSRIALQEMRRNDIVAPVLMPMVVQSGRLACSPRITPNDDLLLTDVGNHS